MGASDGSTCLRSESKAGGAPWARVDRMVFVRFEADQPFVFRPISRVQALARLSHTGSALPWDEADLTSLLRWIRDVAVYELNYNHLDQGRELILELLRP